MRNTGLKQFLVLGLVLGLGLPSLALAEGEGMGAGGPPRGGGGGSSHGSGGFRGGGSAPQRSAPVRSAPVRSAPVRSAPVRSAPTQSYRPPVRTNPPVVNRPTQPSRPTQPVVSRPAPAQNRPVAANPQRPTQPVANRPVTPTRPVANNPVQNRPVTPTKPVANNPVLNKPIAARPVNNKPVADKPVASNPVGNKPVGNRPVGNRPVERPIQPQPGRTGNKNFNMNSNSAPKKGQKLEAPKQYAQHRGAIELDNKRTVNNLRVANNRAAEFRNNVRITNIVNVHVQNFQRNYYGDVRNRGNLYGGYYRDFGYRNYYHNFWRRGFFGGYYYPFVPCYDVGSYLYYPSLYWLYVKTVDAEYYGGWYGAGYVVNPFPFVKVYYPTQTFVNLGIEVAAYPNEVQANFRTAMTNLTTSLAQQLANNLNASLTLAENDIVVTHYDNLQNTAYAMDGYVDDKGLGLHVAFKAYVDLSNPNQTLVFVPTGDQPSPADEATLDLINSRITALGGDPLTADVAANSTAVQ